MYFLLVDVSTRVTILGGGEGWCSYMQQIIVFSCIHALSFLALAKF